MSLQISTNLLHLRIFSNPKLHYSACSQAELGRRLHIPQTRICRLENGHGSVSVYDIMAYAVYFGVSIDDICFGIYEYRDGVLAFYESGMR